ncbi:hypothetical protein C8Q80DRAFT_201764 [Daedaleopsis nitida]|nr:hypothetical protein C8Q80DRAFT_201265 [Daedaleopsis nitida]KAI0739900.1 hypothetical protein C8Q80DRAFT_201764 [Daedaleopsis nitida]
MLRISVVGFLLRWTAYNSVCKCASGCTSQGPDEGGGKPRSVRHTDEAYKMLIDSEQQRRLKQPDGAAGCEPAGKCRVYMGHSEQAGT